MRSRMLTLGLDPGITTGWALVEDRGRVLDCGNWTPEDLPRALDGLLRTVNRASHPLDVAVERLAPLKGGKLGTQLSYVVMAINETLHLFDVSVYEFTPGTWKTSSVARLDVGFVKFDGQSLTQHQKDAVGIARYRLSKRGKLYKARDRFIDAETPMRPDDVPADQRCQECGKEVDALLEACVMKGTKVVKRKWLCPGCVAGARLEGYKVLTD